MDLSKLKEPFTPCDIEWRIQQSGVGKNNKPWGMCLAYVTNRAIMERLDDVCGPENWQNDFRPAPEGGILCGISIKVGEEWITKWDGASNTDIEAVKGGLSNSMKRAAVQWGIGRYLYKLEANWANFVENSKDGKYKAKIKNNYYGWNPPALPAWALPKDSKPEKITQQQRTESPSDPINQAHLKQFQDICSKDGLHVERTAEAYKIRYSKDRMTIKEFNQTITNLKQDIKTGDVTFDLLLGEGE